MARPALDFHRQATLAISAVSALLFLPFSINNLLQGRLYVGGTATMLVLLLLAIARLNLKGRDGTGLLAFALVPAVVAFLALSILRQGLIGVLWCYPAVVAFYFMLPLRRAMLASALLVVVIMPLAWWRFEDDLVVRILATQVAVSAFAAVALRTITAQGLMLRRLADTDPLTGLHNRSTLLTSLGRALEGSRKGDGHASVIVVDLDHFKRINDELGHDAGDAALVEAAGTLKAAIREGDLAFRTGGEEFLLLLPGIGLEDARARAELLRERLGGLRLRDGRRLTASFGVAACDHADDVGAWLKRADRALYRAKSVGRDRVMA